MRLMTWMLAAVCCAAGGAYLAQDPWMQTTVSQVVLSPEVQRLSDAIPLAGKIDVDRPPVAVVEEPRRPRSSVGGPVPVWRVVDLSLAGDMHGDGGIPALSISNSVTRAEATEAPPTAAPRTTVAKPISDTAPAAPRTEVIAAAPTSKVPVSSWEVIGHSVRSRPIHIRRFGNSGDVTLIVCGLEGDDRIAVKWIDSLSQQLADAPEMAQDRQIILLRDPNPDGLTAKNRANDRGVALNRNFPTAAYRPGQDAGPGPASEPETRAVLEVMYRFKPKRVIHVQSAGRSDVAWSGTAEGAARTLGDGLQLPVSPMDVSKEPGSVEDFAATVLGAEVLSMRLSTGDDWRSAAIGHFPALMAAAVPRIGENTLSIAQTSRSKSAGPSEDDISPSPFSESSGISRLDRRGYEDLPAPPTKSGW